MTTGPPTSITWRDDASMVLLTLAWFVELSGPQLHRLHFQAVHYRTVQRLMRGLKDEGFVQCRRWVRHLPRVSATGRTVTTPQPAVWSLTEKGHDLLERHHQYPTDPPKNPRPRRLLQHDTTTAETVVRLIELARQSRIGLEGVYIRPEERLDANERKPIVDMIVALLGGKSFPHPDLVPWTNELGYGTGKLVMYAIENDRGTEILAEIRAKAAAYHRAHTRWKKRYGTFPVVLWVVPTEDRLRNILQAWREVWPEGKCLLTIDGWLATGDRWVRYQDGKIEDRFTLFPTKY